MGRPSTTWLATAATAAVVALAAPAAHAQTEPSRPLLPDLVQEPPSDLTLTVADTKRGERIRLGFRSATQNVGEGELRIHGHRTARRRHMRATQVLAVADGSKLRRPGAGRLRYIRLGDHRHWHLDDFMRYELRRASTFKLVRPGRKTGFCLGDRYNVDIFTRMPGEPDRAIFTRQCGLRRPQLLKVREGISVGHADYYAPDLEGQYFDITTVGPGRYWLVHRADAGERLLESNDDNNAASLLIEIGRADLGGGRKRTSVEPLLVCPGAERCKAA